MREWDLISRSLGFPSENNREMLLWEGGLDTYINLRHLYKEEEVQQEGAQHRVE